MSDARALYATLAERADTESRRTEVHHRRHEYYMNGSLGRRESPGDAIVTRLRALLDEFGLSRHHVQARFHNAMIRALLPKIYGSQWPSARHRVMCELDGPDTREDADVRQLDAAMERRVCAAVLRQLDDKSTDVQSIAVKCLGVLLKKVREAQVGEISDKLCSLILDGTDELRDVYSIGLKTLLRDVPRASGEAVAGSAPSRIFCQTWFHGAWSTKPKKAQRATRAASGSFFLSFSMSCAVASPAPMTHAAVAIFTGSGSASNAAR